jgi:signal transduction histidine kinase
VVGLNGRWRKAGPVDVLVLVLLCSVDLMVSWDRQSSPDWLAVSAVPVLALVTYLPLLWRRKRPLAVLAATVAGSGLFHVAMPESVLMNGVWLALYTVAARESRYRALVGLGMALLPTVLNMGAEARGANPDEQAAAFLTAGLLGLMVTLSVFGVGRWVQWSLAQRVLVAKLAAAQAEAEERKRIARDLHDTVAHAITLIVLQAAGAGRVVDTHPALAAEAMRHVQDVGRQAIDELRLMLGLLEPAKLPGAEPPTDGQLDNIVALVHDLRRAGQEIDLVVEGVPGSINQEAAVAAYRVVQESLTNARKYSDVRRPVEVRVIWAATEVQILVRSYDSADNDSSTPSLSTGHGLRGMQERASAVGGKFKAGSTSDPGFLVSAAFPAAPN